MKHLITGGSGFLGNLIARRLHTRGEQVRILDVWEDASRPRDIEFVKCDIRDAEGVARAMHGVEVVHHNVALVPLTKAGPEFWSVNVEGSRIAAEQAVKAGVKTFIHMSSSAIFGAPDCPVTNDSPFRPVEIYGRAKLAGELAVREISAKAKLPLVVIRPRTILGEGRLGIFQILFQWIAENRKIYVIGDGNQKFQFIHAHDLMDAYLLAMDAGRPGVYNVGTDRFGTLREALDGVITHARSTSRVASLPAGLTINTLRVLDWLRLSPLAPWHYLTYHKAFYFDVSPLLALGWKARYSNDEMFRESWDWFVQNKDRLAAEAAASPHRSVVKQRLLGLLKELVNGGGEIAKYPNTQVPKYPNTQIPKYPNTQIPKYPNTQIPKYPNTQIPKYPNTQISKYPNIQIPKYPNTQISKSTTDSRLSLSVWVFGSLGIWVLESLCFSAKLRALKIFLRQLFLRSRYVSAALAGVLLAAAFPGIGIAGFAWAAPALILAVAWRTTGSESFRLGYVAGLGFYLAALYWLLLIPVAGYPILGWLALSAYLALYPATWLWLLAGRIGAGSWTRRTLWSFAGAAIWVALEMVVSRLFSGFPWLILGNSQSRLLPLIQIASVTGVYGVSFLVVWVSLSLYSATVALLRQPTNRHAWLSEIILPLGALVGVFAFGMGRLREPIPDAPTFRVTLIQPGIPQTMIWNQSENTNRFRQVLELSERALTNQTDLLVWPEAALPQFDEASFIAITNLVLAQRVWMILGTDEPQWRKPPASEDDYDVFNSAFLFAPDGRFMSTYRKQKLVIFGEYIPLIRWLPFIKYFTPITGGFTAGDRPVPFVLERRTPIRLDSAGDSQRADSEIGAPARVKISTLICFEDVFPHVVPEYVHDDTDFLLNLTNDGWFGEGAEQWQHAASAVFRAVENGVPLVRCCNNGLTCWIDSRGALRQVFRDASGRVYGAGAMTAPIPVLAPGERREPTFYNRHGDWFGWGCVVVMAPVLLPRLVKKVRRKRIKETESLQ